MYHQDEPYCDVCGGSHYPYCYADRAPFFRDPGGRSALRAGERNHPCPTCGEPDMLTDEDKRLGYQCDDCADRAEGLGYGRGDY